MQPAVERLSSSSSSSSLDSDDDIAATTSAWQGFVTALSHDSEDSEDEQDEQDGEDSEDVVDGGVGSMLAARLSSFRKRLAYNIYKQSITGSFDFLGIFVCNLHALYNCFFLFYDTL